MRFLSILILILVVSGYSRTAHALDDAQAFSGLTEANAIYDVRTADKKSFNKGSLP